MLVRTCNFAILPKQIDYSNFMTEFELSYRRKGFVSEERDCFNTKLKDIALSSFKLFSDNCKFENNFSAEEINSLNAFMGNKNIIIQKADKGNTVAKTGKEKYIEGVKRTSQIPTNLST